MLASFTPNTGRRQRVFCASLADVFDNAVDPTWREDLFALIRATPNLDWLLLTKRIGNVPSMVSLIPGWLPENVWLGATIVNQAEADRDIQKLLETPARVHFLSIEPMLGPINLESVAWPSIAEHRVDALRGGYWNKAGVLACGPAAGLGEPRGGFTNHSDMPGRIDWVIVGGESGPGARPMHPDWARDLRDQCVSAGVPFLFKQWGSLCRALATSVLGNTSQRLLHATVALSQVDLTRPPIRAAQLPQTAGQWSIGLGRRRPTACSTAPSTTNFRMCAREE